MDTNQRNGKKISIDRLPPHSQESEQAILGCILLDPTQVIPRCIEKLRDGPTTFYDLRHATIYETMIELYDDGIGIDVINLCDRLKVWEKLEQVGGMVYLAQLPDVVPSVVNIDDYIQTVLDKHVLRKMIRVCTEVVGRIYDYEGEVETLMDQCERDVLRISESREEGANLSMPFLVREVLNDIETATQNNGAPSGLSTGFGDLDVITGGLNPGDMILIAARPSMGKSSLAMNIVEHVAIDLHLPVGVCSLEMSAKALINRTVASRSRVNLKNLRDGYLADRDYPKITSAAGHLLQAPIYIDDTAGQSILYMRAKFRRWKQQYDIKLGVIDYLQLANALGNKRRFESRQQEVSDISSGIKNLAKELGIPIIALSQMNREFDKEKNRRPRLSDLRESGSLEQDADIVGFLYRPASDEADTGDAYPVNLSIAKNRNGPRDVDVSLTFLSCYTRFESAARVCDDDLPESTNQQPALPNYDHD
jgi:replicative DNA helicase